MSAKLLFNILSLNEENLVARLESDDVKVRQVALYQLLCNFAPFIWVITNNIISIKTKQELYDFTVDLYISLIEGDRLRVFLESQKGDKSQKLLFFKNYLAGSVRNKANDRHRKRKLNVNTMSNDELNDFAEDFNTDEVAFTAELLDMIESVLKMDKEKEVFNLLRKGKNNEQIANIIGIKKRSVETIKNRMKQRVLQSFNNSDKK